MRFLPFSLCVIFILSACSLSSDDALTKIDMGINARIQHYKKNKITDISDFIFKNKHASINESEASWECDESINTSSNQHIDYSYSFKLSKGKSPAAGVAVNFSFNDWSTDNYVIMPAAAYNGNRFEVLKYKYPPFFQEEEYNVDMPITITDVPRLNKHQGPSRMDLTTADLTTPAIGIYFPKKQRGIWILTEQLTELGKSVLSLTENEDRTKAEFTISAPCVREKIYGMNRLSEAEETGVDWKEGDKATIKCKVFVFDQIHSPAELNNQFLKIRKHFGKASHINQLPFSKAFEIMENQQNTECWDEKNKFYSLGGEGWNMKWQLGWVGGGMITYPLSIQGNTISQQRSFENYHTIITRCQATSGLFYSCGNGTGWCSDCFSQPFDNNLLLLRKNADFLYFIYKYCSAHKNINHQWQMPAEWKKPLNNFAEAFVKIWNRYGQFGQFVDIETGEIKVGGSNSAIMAISGLALASQYEKKPDWLATAIKAGRYYYDEFIKNGISCGGPGEILQNNDSESCFATLESFITLYEVTGEQEWLDYAEDAASLCATWVVSYDYLFPPESLFGQLDMRTSGSIWASTQNKHAGPGICTLSGDCIFKLFRATGNKLYLELIGDIAHNIMQYISREDRPIKTLHPGWINERVNLSDWEGKKNIGNVFHGNTWAQVSAMLTTAEIPGIYLNPAKNELFVFDHVEATFNNNQITITNPTQFDASVKIFVDKDPSKTYPRGFISRCPKVTIKAGKSTVYKLP